MQSHSLNYNDSLSPATTIMKTARMECGTTELAEGRGGKA